MIIRSERCDDFPRCAEKRSGVSGDGTNRNDDWSRGLRRSGHVAAAVKKSAGFHDQTGRENLAGHDGFGLDLDFAFGSHGAMEAAGDNDVIPFDFPFDVRVFAQDQGFVRDESSLRRAVNAKSAGGFKSALELDSLLEKAGPFTRILSFKVKPAQRHPKYLPEICVKLCVAKSYFRMSWSYRRVKSLSS